MIRTLKHTMSADHVPDFTDPATGKKGRIDFNQAFENILLDAIDFSARCLYRKRIEELFRKPAGAAQEVWDALVAEAYMYAMRRKETYNPKYTIVAYAGFCLYHTFSVVRDRYMRPRMRETRLDDLTLEMTEAGLRYTNTELGRFKKNLREEYDENNDFLKLSGCEECQLTFTEFVDGAFADGLQLENCGEYHANFTTPTIKDAFRKEGYEGDFSWMYGG